MRPNRLLHAVLAPALMLAAACADSPTALPGALTAPALSQGSSGGGSTSTTSPTKIAGQWAGAFQSTSAYDSRVSFSLAEAGGVVTGAMTLTLTYGGGVLQSPVTGSWDGTTLTLHFDAPNGRGFVVAVPSAHGRYGVAFVSLVHSESSSSGSALGVLNVGRI